ncbi:MAG TPA: tryptophan halogenase family protein [Ideonella sp.]|uniref:tryptophan halogenase family protein n=1 Tax=Ideonella sp. TaxID=1929293 RepID=UPI002B66AA27|nr:tryptophan halogenase family protein [Ideonella sp.]HSI49883.1 tryptophan halogenase family protein [Ideonella sp.]
MPTQMPPVRNILILGGGTAGWLTACYLARHLRSDRPEGIRIRLVEASDIPIIGVGEGSFPSMRGTLAAIGIDEARFIRECGATFKQGIRFDDWQHAPGTAAARGRSYFHPFSTPSQRPGAPELVPAWVAGAAPGVALADAVTLQAAVVAARRGPKRPGDGDFSGAMNYAYHFDAGKLASLLGRRARELGVQHQIAQVERVALRADGGIAAVHTRCGQQLEADLYIDCSGLRAELIGRSLGVPLKSVSDQLFVDSALALQLPYPAADVPIASCTISAAQEAGWIWDIGLQERRGIGHVFSSRHTDAARAEQVLRAYAGPAADGLPVRALQLPLGYRELQWQHNCVAVGLSSGFLEPLEASGIGLIETAAYLIAHLFPYDGQMAPVARHFNGFMRQRYERIVDFIKLHYGLSQREDSAFWRDNRDPASFSPRLREQLAMWRCRPPHRLDFITDVEMYPPSSWQYVLYGMGFETGRHAAWQAGQPLAAASAEMRQLQALAPHAVADLPDHRALVTQLCGRAAERAPVNARA